MAEIPCPSRSELDLAHRIYLEREPRDLFYRVALELIDLAGHGHSKITSSEALAVLLAVWNAQYYRMHPSHRQTLVDDLDRLLATHRQQLDGFRHRTLESLSTDDEPTVTGVFAEFQSTLGPVGAAKALHLLAPRFFPIWDQHIRRGYHVAASQPGRHADCYRAFMAITRSQVSACGGEAALGRNPIKALDEYNCCRFTLRAPELATDKPPPPQPQPTAAAGRTQRAGRQRPGRNAGGRGTLTVLGIDLATKRWSDVGSALISFTNGDHPVWDSVSVSVIPWPTESPITPAAVADAIDTYATHNQVVAVSIDGPQGWRDPAAPTGQGDMRACERSAHTPGKTGPHGHTKPANQLGWITFSIDVFDRLLHHGHAELLNDPEQLPRGAPPSGHYLLLECFPTVTWKTSGLPSLPAKSKRPDTAGYARDLARRWNLPPLPVPLRHDDLQAIVAALPAAAALGGGQAIAHGTPARLSDPDGAASHRIEGIIWDARPSHVS